MSSERSRSIEEKIPALVRKLNLFPGRQKDIKQILLELLQPALHYLAKDSSNRVFERVVGKKAESIGDYLKEKSGLADRIFHRSGEDIISLVKSNALLNGRDYDLCSYDLYSIDPNHSSKDLHFNELLYTFSLRTLVLCCKVYNEEKNQLDSGLYTNPKWSYSCNLFRKNNGFSLSDIGRIALYGLKSMEKERVRFIAEERDARKKVSEREEWLKRGRRLAQGDSGY